MHGSAYFNGKWVQASELSLPLDDAGVMWGAIIVDRARTFRGAPFRLNDHVERFFQSCRLAQIPIDCSAEKLTDIAAEVAHRNYFGSDISVVFVATPGTPDRRSLGTLIVHALPIDFERIRSISQNGVSLKSQVVSIGGDARIKHRSRLPWWIATQAASVDNGEPLFIDPKDHIVLETASANIAIVREDSIWIAPSNRVLPGISLKVLRELCSNLKISIAERSFSLSDIDSATEALLTCTTYCLAGISCVDGKPIPFPGPMLNRLIFAWSAYLGADIHAENRGIR